jgi:hypothetical protein
MTKRHLEGPRAAMSGDTIKGIPRVDPRTRPAGWKRAMQRVVATTPGAAVHRTIAARLDTPIMKATGGRVTLAVGAVPVVVLTTTGARSGRADRPDHQDAAAGARAGVGEAPTPKRVRLVAADDVGVGHVYPAVSGRTGGARGSCLW